MPGCELFWDAHQIAIGGQDIPRFSGMIGTY
jgi:hypothetical protein